MYIPLFNKSNYTLLSSLLKIDDIISYAKGNNLPSIALTDTNMYGTMEFITKCKKQDIKPIIGLNIVIENNNFVLLIKNYNGYKNLIKLSTIQNEREVTIEELKTYNEDLIAIIPYSSKELYSNFNEIYKELYLGYQNKLEEKNVKEMTKNIVFLQESLYLNSNDKEILPYLYRIRDGKTITDEIEYNTDNHELNIKNIFSHFFNIFFF